MPISITDMESLIRLLDEHPEWAEALQERLVNENALMRLLQQRPELREAVRRYILTEEILQVPSLLRELIELSRQTTEQQHQQSEQLRQQSELLRQHSGILQEHTEQLRQQSELLRQHSGILQEHTEQLRQQSELLRQHSGILQEHTEQLRQHSDILRQHTEQLRWQSDTLQQHTEQLRQQSELIRQNSELLRQHSVMLQHILEVQEHLLRDSQDLKEWRRGEEGRRAGERFELQTIRRAPRLMNGGVGGRTEEPHVRQQLTQWLQNLWQQEPDQYPEDEDDPTLADLIWWKDNQVAVLEISLKVNGYDVVRARRRADILRRAGVNAIPMVIGEEWASPESKMLAEQNAVEWLIKGDLSPGYIAFRRMRGEPS